jgi:hypothetical protein
VDWSRTPAGQEVDGQEAVPVSFGQLGQLSPLIDTRIVDRDVQPSKLHDRRLDRRAG